MKQLVFILLSLFVLTPVYAFCPKKPVKINIVTKPGKVIYDHSHSRQEFGRLSHTKVSPNTLGLTATKLDISMDGESYIEGRGARKCTGVSSVTFYIGYDEIKVYIDKKYPKNSCNYRVIKEHEDYHVGVAQQAISFFKPDIERELKKAVQQLTPEVTYSSERANQVMVRQFTQIKKHLQPLLNHINNKIASKNYEIDTPESYRETTKLCPKW